MKICLIFISVIFCLSALANEDTIFLDQAFREEKALPRARLSADEIYRRTNIVLSYFNVTKEPDYQSELESLPLSSSLEQMQGILKSLDPEKQFGRYFELSGEVRGFADRDAKKVPELRIPLNAAQGARPLQGLRVALDPGHMGGDVWDKRTGKYVQNSAGVRVSEGLINLQTSLLVEQRLLALGAEVLVTHRGLSPATALHYEKLDLQEYGKRELRARTLEDWFQSLLASTSETNLGPAFKGSSAVKKAFSEIMRGDYYATRADLDARADMIAAFRPDLTVVIHFDASAVEPVPGKRNITRAYVPGSFGKTEFGTAEARAHFLAHLGQGTQWNDSVRLSQLIVSEISSKLGSTIPSSDMSGTTPVLPGVFARNLALTREVVQSPISYLECLTYGSLDEFNRLAKTDGGTLEIDGKSVPYSRRLASLADAITAGIVKFRSR